jgi:hypothetical protein
MPLVILEGDEEPWLEISDGAALHAVEPPELDRHLHAEENLLDLAVLRALAAGAGLAVEEAHVMAAQQSEVERLSDEKLQERARGEGTSLRYFMPG